MSISSDFTRGNFREKPRETERWAQLLCDGSLQQIDYVRSLVHNHLAEVVCCVVC